MSAEDNAHARNDVHSLEYERYHPIQPGDRVLDLGAHVGYFTALVAPRCSFVVSFEPNPDNFRELRSRCDGLANTVLINKAAFDLSGFARLHECPTNSGAHSLFKHGQCSDVSWRVERVDIGIWLRLANYIPDFIKMDTEGAEGAIVESLMRCHVHADMAIETHDANLYWQCRNAIEAAGHEWFPKVEHVGICHVKAKR